ncbi:MAG: hypothetical protein WC799_05685 [Desulfobacteraceae bacterium]|jgi:hypothetical protein
MGNETKEFRRLFPKGHIPIILSRIVQAGETLCKETENDLENWISRRLYYRLIRIDSFRNGPLDIRLQPEIVSVDSDENHAQGQIDFLVSCGFGAEVYFAIEAKRLRFPRTNGTINTGNDAYVNDGMMRFVEGQYAPFMTTGAMLGYIFDGNLSKSCSGVAKYIGGKKNELKLMPPQKLTTSKILPTNDVYETRHDLNERDFTLYHIFLTV